MRSLVEENLSENRWGGPSPRCSRGHLLVLTARRGWAHSRALRCPVSAGCPAGGLRQASWPRTSALGLQMPRRLVLVSGFSQGAPGPQSRRAHGCVRLSPSLCLSGRTFVVRKWLAHHGGCVRRLEAQGLREPGSCRLISQGEGSRHTVVPAPALRRRSGGSSFLLPFGPAQAPRGMNYTATLPTGSAGAGGLCSGNPQTCPETGFRLGTLRPVKDASGRTRLTVAGTEPAGWASPAGGHAVGRARSLTAMITPEEGV